jgi:transposase
VEGTGSYGAGLARHLKGAGIAVMEVERPKRRHLPRRGKSDPIDAERAARDGDSLLQGLVVCGCCVENA